MKLISLKRDISPPRRKDTKEILVAEVTATLQNEGNETTLHLFTHLSSRFFAFSLFRLLAYSLFLWIIINYEKITL